VSRRQKKSYVPAGDAERARLQRGVETTCLAVYEDGEGILARVYSATRSPGSKRRSESQSLLALLRLARLAVARKHLGKIRRAAEGCSQAKDLSKMGRRTRHLPNERAQIVGGIQALSLGKETEQFQLVIRKEQVEAILALNGHGFIMTI